jgi:hypothetical protein
MALLSPEGGHMTQYALHVTDYYCFMAMKVFREMGACQRKADRRLTDYEFDHNQFSEENGNGPIY